MSKKKSIMKHFKLPQFNSGYSVLFDLEYKERASAYTQKMDGDGHYPLIVFDARYPIAMTTIIHEVIHAVRYEFEERRGFENLEKWGDEFLPYTVAYVYSEIVKFCRKKKIKLVDCQLEIDKMKRGKQ